MDRIARWLAYADSCVNASTDLARCQPFWTQVAIVLGALCVAVVAGAVARVIIDRRKARRYEPEAASSAVGRPRR